MPRWPGSLRIRRTLNGHEAGNGGDGQGDDTYARVLSTGQPGGQGVHREVESEGHEEKYRAVVDGGDPDDEPVGQRWDQGRARTMGAKAFSFTQRTKVFADGTVRKIWT